MSSALKYQKAKLRAVEKLSKGLKMYKNKVTE